MRLFFFLIILVFETSCQAQEDKVVHYHSGAERTDLYLGLISEKRVALVVNQTSLVGKKHLLDTLLLNKIQVVKVFSPEHGFRGDGDAGATISSETDRKTGLPIVSLYGSKKKPTLDDLQDIDVVVFDIQDVGVRFYTYITTLKYVMEACAEENKPLIVLDRPNPNGEYIDGPVLDNKFISFVGALPIPIVYGLTIGELATMMNEERWLNGGLYCDLKVITIRNYSHHNRVDLPIKPSPNLPNRRSIRLYPSLCFFEATEISVGRGTDDPFELIGYPDKVMGEYRFTPRSKQGMSLNPPHKDKECYGLDLRNGEDNEQFTLKYLIDMYSKFPVKSNFFINPRFFNLLAGNDQLIEQIKQGVPEDSIRKSWQPQLTKFRNIRIKYLLYP